MIIIVNAKPSPPASCALAQPTLHADSHSQCGDPVQQFYLTNFLTAVGYDPEYSPLAALLAPTYHIDKPCLIVTPIHWVASHNDVMIKAAGSDLTTSESQMRVWFNELSQFLAPDGFQLIYHDSAHWLVLPPDGHTLTAPNVGWMYNRSMMPVLSKLDKTLYWQRLMTEVQMFLGSHPLNQQKNQPYTVNGLWFWGGSVLDKPVNQTIYTDSSIIRKVFPDAASLPSDRIAERTLGRGKTDKNSIMVMEQYDPALLAHYEQCLRHQKIHWIWHQYHYTTGKRRFWLRRLWEYLKG